MNFCIKFAIMFQRLTKFPPNLKLYLSNNYGNFGVRYFHNDFTLDLIRDASKIITLFSDHFIKSLKFDFLDFSFSFESKAELKLSIFSLEKNLEPKYDQVQ